MNLLLNPSHCMSENVGCGNSPDGTYIWQNLC